MAKVSQKTLDAIAEAAGSPIPLPTLGIRTMLRALAIATSHRQRITGLGGNVDSILAQVDASLTDAYNQLKHLESTAPNRDAARCIGEVLERLQ
jgi:hypothetical protein